MRTITTLRLCAAMLALCVFSIRTIAQDALPVLKTRTEDYANVTLISQSDTHLFVKHSRGLASIKRTHIEESDLNQLVTGAITPVATESNIAGDVVTASSGTEGEMVAEEPDEQLSLAESLDSFWQKSTSQIGLGTVIGVVLGVMFLLYLFNCYCLKRVCKNAGYDPGILIWFPILQVFPLLRAAGMSAWWFIGLLVPVVGFVVTIIWCIKICDECGKGLMAKIFLILPFTSPFAFLYLAFSSSGGSETAFAVPRRSGEPLPA